MLSTTSRTRRCSGTQYRRTLPGTFSLPCELHSSPQLPAPRSNKSAPGHWYKSQSVMRRILYLSVLSLSLAFCLAISLQAAECARSSYECAVSDFEHRNFEGAIGQLNALLQVSPDNLKALNLLGI